MGPHPSVFMSFAWVDRELADQVTKSLNDAGLTVNRPDTELGQVIAGQRRSNLR